LADIAGLASVWGQLATPPTLVADRENQVFEVRYDDGRRGALRLHRPGYHSVDGIKAELDWMQQLAESGCPVPTPFTTSGGTLLVQDERHIASCVEWIDAKSVSDQELSTAELIDCFVQLGKVIYKLHVAARQIVPGTSRHRWDHDGLLGDAPVWGRFWQNPSLTPQEQAKLLSVRDAARLWLRDRTGRHIIHADLLSENILLQGETLWIIDFDDAGVGFLGYDLGTALVQYHDDVALNDMAAALCHGYGSMSPDDALRFMALRAFASAGWAMTRLAPTDPLQRVYAERALGQVHRF